MEKDRLILEDVDLTKYVTRRLNGYDEYAEKIFSMLKEKNFVRDEEVMRILKENDPVNFKYPEIDLSFLQMANKLRTKVPIDNSGKVEYESENISVPKFSIYQFYGEKIFRLEFEHLGVPYLKFMELRITNGLGSNKDIFGNNLSKIFENENLSLSSLYKLKTPREENILHLSFEGEHKYIKKYGNSEEKNLILESKFNGRIPEATIEKVRKSEVDFKKKNIYIITETKPKEWNAIYDKTDPLVIGIKNDKKAYLIDHFNTTPLESIVKDNYRKFNRN